MQHNDDTFGTRDLASASDPAPDDRNASSDDRTAPSNARTRNDVLTATNDAPAATDAPTRDTSGESGSALSSDATPGAGNAGVPAATDAGSASASDDGEPLLAAELTTTFSRDWEEVQVQFVDHPRGAVEEADRLVAAVMKRLAEDFAREREQLEAQWDRGEDISTEDLRVALQRYRSFFRRLLST